MKIPSDLSLAEVQAAFRDVAQTLERMAGGPSKLNTDLKGRRVINAGDAVQAGDYVTKRQLDAAVASIGPAVTAAVLASLTVNGTATFNGDVFASLLEDAGIVFAKVGGQLVTDVDGLSYRYTNGGLRLGDTGRYEWHHGAEMHSPADGVIKMTADDNNDFVELALGPRDGTDPSLKVNGGDLEVRLSNAGAVTGLKAGTIEGTAYKVNGTPGADGTGTTITAITVEKGIVTAITVT